MPKSHAPATLAHAPDAPDTAMTPPAPEPLKPPRVDILVRSDIPGMLRQIERRTGMTAEQSMSLALCVADGHAANSVWRQFERPAQRPEVVPENGYQYGVSVSQRWYDAHGPIAWSLGLSLGDLLTIAVPAVSGWVDRVPKFRISGNPKVEAGMRRLNLQPKSRTILGYTR